MPSATDKNRQVGDMWERGSGSACLEARWKKGGTVVDDVVEHRGISIGRRTTGKREGGRNNKYTAMQAIQIQHMENTTLTVL